MPFARCSLPRHILYIGVALAVALSMSACADREETEPRVSRKLDANDRAASGTSASSGSSGAGAPAVSGGPNTPGAPTRDQEALDPALDRAPSNGADDGAETTDETPRRAWRGRKGRPIEIILRSSPPGAVAAVDGVAIGPTPSIWEGFADATAREFSFVLPGYAVARYRFVPTRSGIVHGKLEPIKAEFPDEPATRPAPGRQADTRPQ